MEYERAPIGTQPDMQPRPELINPALDWLASLDAQDSSCLKGSPLERTGRKRILRNVAMAMGNSRDRRFLSQLGRLGGQTADEILRDTAEWARAQIITSNPDQVSLGTWSQKPLLASESR